MLSTVTGIEPAPARDPHRPDRLLRVPGGCLTFPLPLHGIDGSAGRDDASLSEIPGDRRRQQAAPLKKPMDESSSGVPASGPVTSTAAVVVRQSRLQRDGLFGGLVAVFLIALARGWSFTP